MYTKITNNHENPQRDTRTDGAGTVEYLLHEKREHPELAEKFGLKPEELGFFNMYGDPVDASRIPFMIHETCKPGHLMRKDDRFLDIVISPSDKELEVMGATIAERINKGKGFVLKCMDAYAKNFHRKGINDRFDLTAFAIPHVYKKKTPGSHIHWHIIVCRISLPKSSHLRVQLEMEHIVREAGFSNTTVEVTPIRRNQKLDF